MATVDRWTDNHVDRVCRLMRMGEAIVRYMRHPNLTTNSIRKETIDRWLADAAAFNGEYWGAREEAEDAEAEAD